MNEPTVATRAVLERPSSPGAEEFPPASGSRTNQAESRAPRSLGSPVRAGGKWPIAAPGVPSHSLPTPARAAAAARLFGAVETASEEADPEAPTLTATPARAAALATAAARRTAPAPAPAPGRAAAAAPATTAAAAAAAAPPEPSEPAEEARRHLRAVPPRTLSPAQRRRRTRALLLAGAGVVVMVAFGLVYLHVVLAQRQFALDQLTQKVQTDRSTYERLRVQVAELGSPVNIISRAEGQLGMRQPASVTYLTPTVTIGGAAASSGLASTATGPVQAPAGVADWPQIKAQLAGSP